MMKLQMSNRYRYKPLLQYRDMCKRDIFLDTNIDLVACEQDAIDPFA
jgi:hypothetical protein